MKAFLRSVAMAVSVAGLLGSAGYVAAAEDPDGYYAIFANGSIRGAAGLMDNTSPKLLGVLKGLTPNAEYYFAGHTVGCNGQTTLGNRVFGLRRRATASGALVLRDALANSNIVRSMWLVRIDQLNSPVCTFSINYAKVNVAAGDYDGNGALEFAQDGEVEDYAIIDSSPAGEDLYLLTIGGAGYQAGDSYRLSFVNRACGRAPTATPLTINVSGIMAEWSRSMNVNLTQDQLDSLRSVRIRNMTDGVNVGCRPLSIIASLVA